MRGVRGDLKPGVPLSLGTPCALRPWNPACPSLTWNPACPSPLEERRTYLSPGLHSRGTVTSRTLRACCAKGGSPGPGGDGRCQVCRSLLPRLPLLWQVDVHRVPRHQVLLLQVPGRGGLGGLLVSQVPGGAGAATGAPSQSGARRRGGGGGGGTAAAGGRGWV